ncbi:MAG: phosphotransferase, partial [Gammaproteobacteria bacterium]
MSDSRLKLLTQWTRDTVRTLLGASLSSSGLEPVSGDASFRRYFRARAGEHSFIAVDAPPQNEDSETFVRLSNLFRDAQVCAPKVFAQDFQQGFLLLDDFGDDLLLTALLQAQQDDHIYTADSYYQEAIAVLLNIQQKVDGSRLDSYDRSELRREMDLFPRWYCENFLAVDYGGRQSLIDKTFTFLEDAALFQLQVPVHRDYHSRNLMLIDPASFGNSHRLGVIDFQDAVLGAYSYDLVSLLRDCYIRWDEQQLDRWAGFYLEQATARNIVTGLSAGQLQRDLDLMGLQRHLKVMGIFARLAIRDKKPRYLADIPLVIRYFLDVAGRYPELADFLNWFVDELLPRAEKKL